MRRQDSAEEVEGYMSCDGGEGYQVIVRFTVGAWLRARAGACGRKGDGGWPTSASERARGAWLGRSTPRRTGLLDGARRAHRFCRGARPAREGMRARRSDLLRPLPFTRGNPFAKGGPGLVGTPTLETAAVVVPTGFVWKAPSRVLDQSRREELRQTRSHVNTTRTLQTDGRLRSGQL